MQIKWQQLISKVKTTEKLYEGLRATFRKLFYGTTKISEKIVIGNMGSRSAIRTINNGIETTLL